MMEGWEKYQIGDLVLKSKLRDPKKESEKYFKYVDVSSVSRESYTITRYTITKGAEAPSRARKVIQTDDVIFATVRPTLMRISLVSPELNNEICSTGYCVLKPNKKLINPDFLYYSVLTKYFISKIEKLQRGASYPAIRDSDLRDQFINVPLLPEQRKIAYVLGMVQKAIEKQDRLIKTTTELKKNLMQKLFTEGLNNEPQKETEIGLVPVSWEVVELDEVCYRVTVNIEPKENGETPYVGLEHINPGRIRLNNCGKENEVVSSKAKFNSGEILYGKLRPYLDKAVHAHIGGMCSTDILVFTGKNGVKNDFLIHLFHTDKLIDFAKSTTTGVQHPRTSWNSLKKLIIGLPKKEERTEIANALKTIEDKLEFHEKKKQTLTSLFNTLLHDLMTGQRRVHELEFEGMVKDYKQIEQPLSIAAED